MRTLKLNMFVMLYVAFISHQILVAYSQATTRKHKDKINNQILGIEFFFSIYRKITFFFDEAYQNIFPTS